MTRIKICGLTRPEDVRYVNTAKPDWCGFILNFPSSRRNVTPEQARALLPALMETATFGRPESFAPVWVEGLDEAYWDGMDSVAQKGSLAYSITVNHYSTADDEAYDVLRALGAADFSAWQ